LAIAAQHRTCFAVFMVITCVMPARRRIALAHVAI
ncbi:hypothetical protein LTSEALA_6308, partial [Salmonella enterica subsp. enterica serovar Alachua str. R6-377]